MRRSTTDKLRPAKQASTRSVKAGQPSRADDPRGSGTRPAKAGLKIAVAPAPQNETIGAGESRSRSTTARMGSDQRSGGPSGVRSHFRLSIVGRGAAEPAEASGAQGGVRFMADHRWARPPSKRRTAGGGPHNGAASEPVRSGCGSSLRHYHLRSMGLLDRYHTDLPRGHGTRSSCVSCKGSGGCLHPRNPHRSARHRSTSRLD